jgi:ribulose-5-phosphate 4-epimerase/fuculose-1-phosphate aldolase
MTEREAREALVEYGRSLFERGYSCGTSGNLSVRLPDGGGYLMSPTNVSLGRLTADTISRLDTAGCHLDGAPPTKEGWLHMAMYAARPQDHAVVHLHSTYATALSCRRDRPADDVLPPLTPYVIMRVGRVALAACTSLMHPTNELDIECDNEYVIARSESRGAPLESEAARSV